MEILYEKNTCENIVIHNKYPHMLFKFVKKKNLYNEIYWALMLEWVDVFLRACYDFLLHRECIM